MQQVHEEKSFDELGSKSVSKRIRPPLPPRTYKLNSRQAKETSPQEQAYEHEESKCDSFCSTSPSKNDMIFDLCLPGYTVKVDLLAKVQRPFVAYFVQVQCANGVGWTVEKRFSEFFSFWRDLPLKKYKGNIIPPKFPSRFSRKGSFSRELLEYRRHALEDYIKAVLRICTQLKESPLHSQGDTVYNALESFLEAEEGRKTYITRGRSRSGSFFTQYLHRETLKVNDRLLLQGRELMKAILQNHPHFVTPSTTPGRLTGMTFRLDYQENDRILSELGRMAALQQNMVDKFVDKILREYPLELFSKDSLGDEAMTCASSDGGEKGQQHVNAKSHYDEGSQEEEELEALDDMGDSSDEEDVYLEETKPLPSGNTTAQKTVLQKKASSSRLLGPFFPVWRRRKTSSIVSEEELETLADELYGRVRRYIAQISAKVLKANMQFVTATKTAGFEESSHLDVLHRLFEVSLLKRHPKLRDLLLHSSYRVTELAEKDAAIQAKVQWLRSHFQARGIPPSLFGACIHPQFSVLENSLPQTKKNDHPVFCWGWESAVAHLNELEDHEAFSTPSDKAELIMKCVREIQAGLAYAHGSVSRKDDPKVLGADDFVPIFFYVIACSRVKSPCAMHHFITTLASDELLDTEVKYWLTVYESGLHFLYCLDINNADQVSQ